MRLRIRLLLMCHRAALLPLLHSWRTTATQTLHYIFTQANLLMLLFDHLSCFLSLSLFRFLSLCISSHTPSAHTHTQKRGHKILLQCHWSRQHIPGTNGAMGQVCGLLDYSVTESSWYASSRARTQHTHTLTHTHTHGADEGKQNMSCIQNKRFCLKEKKRFREKKGEGNVTSL